MGQHQYAVLLQRLQENCCDGPARNTRPEPPFWSFFRLHTSYIFTLHPQQRKPAGSKPSPGEFMSSSCKCCSCCSIVTWLGCPLLLQGLFTAENNCPALLDPENYPPKIIFLVCLVLWRNDWGVSTRLAIPVKTRPIAKCAREGDVSRCSLTLSSCSCDVLWYALNFATSSVASCMTDSKKDKIEQQYQSLVTYKKGHAVLQKGSMSVPSSRVLQRLCGGWGLYGVIFGEIMGANQKDLVCHAPGTSERLSVLLRASRTYS